TEPKSQRAGNDADLATPLPFSRCAVDTLLLNGKPENRLAERQSRYALRRAASLQRRAEQHRPARRQRLFAKLQSPENDESTEAMADEVQALGILCARELKQGLRMVADATGYRRVGERDRTQIAARLESLLEHAELEPHHPEAVNEDDGRRRR